MSSISRVLVVLRRRSASIVVLTALSVSAFSGCRKDSAPASTAPSGGATEATSAVPETPTSIATAAPPPATAAASAAPLPSPTASIGGAPGGGSSGGSSKPSDAHPTGVIAPQRNAPKPKLDKDDPSLPAGGGTPAPPGISPTPTSSGVIAPQ
ncbi:MAG: hypothetical protein U0165_20865 [Polyangiaceae bacterium]